jgi:integrase
MSSEDRGADMSKNVPVPSQQTTALAKRQRLAERARAYAQSALSPHTRRNYAAQIKLWLAWSDEHERPGLPADPTDVSHWLTDRADAGQKVGTLRTAIAALKSMHAAKGHPFDTTHPDLVHVMKGIAREHGSVQRQVEPLRALDVMDIVAACEATPKGRRDAALFALGYVFALRRSELVGLDFDKLGSGTGFIQIKATTIELTLARSKTAGSKPEPITIPRAPNADAVKAIEAWLEEAGIGPGEPLLRRVTKGGKIRGRLHAQSVALIIKTRVADHHVRKGVPLATAQAEADKFSGHSLRVGFATTAAESGADLRAISSVTRHKTMEMPRRYAQRADQLKTSPYNLDGVGLEQRRLRGSDAA